MTASAPGRSFAHDAFSGALGNARGSCRTVPEAAAAFLEAVNRFDASWDRPGRVSDSELRGLGTHTAQCAADLDRALEGERGYGLVSQDISYTVDKTEPTFPILTAQLHGATLGALIGDFSVYDTAVPNGRPLGWDLMPSYLLMFDDDDRAHGKMELVSNAEAPEGTTLPWQHAAWLCHPDTFAAAQQRGSEELLRRLRRRVELGGAELT